MLYHHAEVPYIDFVRPRESNENFWGTILVRLDSPLMMTVTRRQSEASIKVREPEQAMSDPDVAHFVVRQIRHVSVLLSSICRLRVGLVVIDEVFEYRFVFHGDQDIVFLEI